MSLSPRPFAAIILFFVSTTTGCATAGEVGAPAPTPSSPGPSSSGSPEADGAGASDGASPCAERVSIATDGLAAIPASQLRAYSLSGPGLVDVRPTPDGRQLLFLGRRPGSTVVALDDVTHTRRCVDVQVTPERATCSNTVDVTTSAAVDRPMGATAFYAVSNDAVAAVNRAPSRGAFEITGRAPGSTTVWWLSTTASPTCTTVTVR